MRLPGTLNVKEPTPVPCEVVEEYTIWTRYSLDEVRRAVEGARSSATPARTALRDEGRAVTARGEPAAGVSRVAQPGNEEAAGGESVLRYPALPHGYALRNDGRRAPKPVKVSDSLIRITDIQEDVDTGQVSLLVSFDYLGAARTVSISAR